MRLGDGRQSYGLIGGAGYSLGVISNILVVALLPLALTAPGIGAVGAFPWVGFAGPFLVPSIVGSAGAAVKSLAWIMAGIDVRKALFMANGIVGLIVAIAASSFPAFLPPTGPGALAPLLAFLVLALVFAILALASLILEIISLFRASGTYGVRYFKYAAILAIVWIMALVAISIVFIAATMGRPPALGAALFGPLILGIALLSVPMTLALLFAGLGFFSVRRAPTATTSQAT